MKTSVARLALCLASVAAAQDLIPDRPFRIVVSGQDSRGQPFRRIDSPLRTPKQT